MKGVVKSNRKKKEQFGENRKYREQKINEDYHLKRKRHYRKGMSEDKDTL